MKLYLNELGIACALGVDKESITHKLFSPKFTFDPDFLSQDREKLISGKQVVVKRIPGELDPLEIQFHDLNSRNNQILKLVLDQIKYKVDQLKITYGSSRIAIVLGTSTSGMLEGQKAFRQHFQTNTWPEEYDYHQQELQSPAEFAKRYLELTGPAYTISTACSSSGKALCSASRLLKAGVCDAVIVGGVDSLCDMTLNGFDSLESVSEDLCIPFSKNRQGITIGEGAAVFIMSQHQSDIEYAGGGESSDAYHISAPSPLGEGAEVAIEAALVQAGISNSDINYINLHGTGTIANDAAESHCINRLFGDGVCVSSTKAITGHALGAAGAIEAAFLWLSLMNEENRSIPVPAHIWDGIKDPSLPTLTFSQSQDRIAPTGNTYCLMSNSFAFGGSNVSLILRKETHHD